MNGKDIALAVAKATKAVAVATGAVPRPQFRNPMLLADVNPKVESAVDLLKEMYNEVVAAAILKSPVQLQIFDDSFRKKQKSEELMLLMKETCDVIVSLKALLPLPPYSSEPDHLPKVATALSKVGAAINLKILINGKDLNTAIAEDVAATFNARKALKAVPIKLKIMINGKDIALSQIIYLKLSQSIRLK
ncbi:unnamed protein product [Prunus armeniaca]|uniref:Uncharacterized protein n=1 Tax=Prunus armeniaca TaxID=36596 RepID=A0A6J5TSS8_PRUAR|nr:unnamed protein product [Prunus armeniaca]